MGPLFIDLVGIEVTAEESELLSHPSVGGVIFFSRNFESVEQLMALVADVRSASTEPLLLAVDQEGGRVQRFCEGFTRLPAMGELASMVDTADDSIVTDAAWLMAAELLCCDIDISFAPVVDINGISEVIGDRSLSSDPRRLVSLAKDYLKGMAQAGMAATLKHFPGHGNVREDSHVAMPVDNRSREQIEGQDLRVFAELFTTGMASAVMPAHVIYPAFDPEPAGFSDYWLQHKLRGELKFNGVIFSDDLSMHGASVKGGYAERAIAALDAGADMLLACNNREGLLAALAAIEGRQGSSRVSTMLKRQQWDWHRLKRESRWRKTHDRLTG